ncbi:MAG: hypothetical protein Q9225_007851, partial [Loekoesia sp. 1 TL-2023]
MKSTDQSTISLIETIARNAKGVRPQEKPTSLATSNAPPIRIADTHIVQTTIGFRNPFVQIRFHPSLPANIHSDNKEVYKLNQRILVVLQGFRPLNTLKKAT